MVENMGGKSLDALKTSATNQKKRNKKEIHELSIEALRKPITRLIESMRKEIETGSYGLIIGDDASGRIPTLIIREIINKIYSKNGFKRPMVRFLALYPTWGYSNAWDSLPRKFGDTAVSAAASKISSEFIPSIDKEDLSDKKVLIVTDTVSSGSSVAPLAIALKEAGFKVDLATVSLMKNDSKHYGTVHKLHGGGIKKIFFGQGHEPAIYKKRDISGVEKNKNIFSLQAKTFKGRSSETSRSLGVSEEEIIREATNIQNSVNTARADSKQLGQEIFLDIDRDKRFLSEAKRLVAKIFEELWGNKN